MENFDKIFELVRKTNPTITREELVLKMGENKLVAIALFAITDKTT